MRMDKDAWIASRTDTPEKLGKETWGDYYNQVKNLELRGIKMDVSPEIQTKMFGEFLEKKGASQKDANDAVIRGALLPSFQSTDEEFNKTLVPKDIKKVVDLCKSLSSPKISNTPATSKER